MNESYNNSNNYCSTSNTNGSYIKQEFKRSSPFTPNLNSKHIKIEIPQNPTARVKEESASQKLSNSPLNITLKEEEMAEDIAERSFLFGEISSSGNIKVKEEGEEGESSNNVQMNQSENSNTNNNSGNNDENVKQEEEEEDPFDEMSLLDDLSFLEEEFNQLGTPSQVLNSKTYLRLTILEKATENFLNTSNYWEPQIKLNCLHRQSEQSVTVLLRGSWMQTPIKIGENVNLIGQLNFDNECIVNDQENLFIINPDLLINSTQIASSYNCLRSSILQNKSMIIGSYTKPLIIGTFLHDLLEVCLNSNNFDDSFMSLQLERLLRENGDQLYSANLTEEEIMEDLNLGKQKLQSWSKKYVSETLKPNKFSKTSHKFENSLEEPSEFSITEAKSVEELIWSPKYGIKGKIDLIVELLRNDVQGNEKVNLVPLEFKTGKVGFNLNYEVQTMLYQLLLSEKYKYNTELGIIFILNGDEEAGEQLIKIHSIRPRIIGLIQARNRLASYLGEVSNDEGEEKLPEIIKNKYICGRCNQLQSCMLTHKTFEQSVDEQANLMGIQGLYEQITGHLTPTQLEFYKYWLNFLNLEETFIKVYKKEIWSKTSKELEEKGKCFSEMMLVGYTDSSEWVNVIEFKKLDLSSQTQQQDKSILSNFSLLESGTNISVSQPTVSRDPLPHTSMEVGDPVVISTEAGIFGIAVGVIVELTSQSVKIALSKEFSPPLKKSPEFNNQINQKFYKFTDYNEFIQSTAQQISSEELFRIDKDEYEQGMKLIRGNLINLMTLQTHTAIRLRELIIDLKPPRLIKQNFDRSNEGFNKDGRLNPDQEAACLAAINNEDYTLILGMPGTGKTTTIAHLVKYLVQIKNQSILITSYTHSSLDNILLKLVNLGLTDFLRLGSLNKVHNEIKRFCINHPDNKIRSVAEAERVYGKTPIIATTCLGMNHFLFDKRKFNYTIIDEASQLTLPTSIAPLLVSNKFILVGDHYQLPPLLRDQNLQREASNSSLFKILAENWPESVSKIRYQYRMNSDIMKLSNKLIYSDSLHCGNEQVANSKLILNNPEWVNNSLHSLENSSCYGGEGCWLKHCLNPNNNVIFLNTQKLKDYEVREGELIYNEAEISLIEQLVSSFSQSGLSLTRIGVLSPYKKQTSLLQKKFSKVTDLEILTIDKSQGRDKELIIISLVRSNATEKVGNLLKDWKRINVALTRAKFKLILIGNRATLMGGTYLFRELVNILESDNKVFELDDGCLDEHKFKALDNGSQLSLSNQSGDGVRCNRVASVKEYSQSNSVLLKELEDEI